jgi:hypothetical protein
MVRLVLFALPLLFLVGFSSDGFAQVVAETAFCKGIKQKGRILSCDPALPSGKNYEVKLSALPTVKGHPTVYVFADLGTEQYSAAIVSLRKGTCYDDDVVVTPNAKIEQSAWTEFANYFSNGWHVLMSMFDQINVDVSRAGPKASFKVTPIKAYELPHNNRYDFLFVDCAGTLEVKIVDARGNLLSGNSTNVINFIDE